ncbi:hypothetical protein AB0442_16820 [Kitasatospora sp. NPDC085895]|uniref:DUF6924 domain-containing protein n=1 Tax=Kitasatospora sp. NPDC085895 TaxID=3155057 RepID=UPI0034506F84
MTELPEIVGREDSDALIVRTDYTDQAAWRAVVAAASRARGLHGEYEAEVHLVDDPVWTGATPEAVRAAAGRDTDLGVVFLADRTTMESARLALLALDTGDEEDPADDPPAREFRASPAAVHEVHVNLMIANLDFADFAEAATEDPEGILEHL